MEIGARAHDLRAVAEELEVARGGGDGAVFLVGGGGGEDDIGDLGGVGQEHFLHDEEFELSSAVTESAEVREGICAHDVQSFELAGLRCFHNLRRGQAGLRGNYRAPEFDESYAV